MVDHGQVQTAMLSARCHVGQSEGAREMAKRHDRQQGALLDTAGGQLSLWTERFHVEHLDDV